MTLWKMGGDELSAVTATKFSDEGIRERDDLQRLLRAKIEAIAPNVLVIAEEYSEWAESRRRIDLLAIDANANLVVIELNTTEGGGHMELQAIRYAAMVSTMNFAKVSMRGKSAEKRQARRAHGKMIRYDLRIGDTSYTNLWKREVVRHIVAAVIARGAMSEQVSEHLPGMPLVDVEGTCESGEFLEKLGDLRTARGGTYDPRMYFTSDDELFHVDGRTYAFSNHWGGRFERVLRALADAYPDLPVDLRENTAGNR